MYGDDARGVWDESGHHRAAAAHDMTGQPEGWYADPRTGGDGYRWWDGTTWTEAAHNGIPLADLDVDATPPQTEPLVGRGLVALVAVSVLVLAIVGISELTGIGASTRPDRTASPTTAPTTMPDLIDLQAPSVLAFDETTVTLPADADYEPIDANGETFLCAPSDLVMWACIPGAEGEPPPGQPGPPVAYCNQYKCMTAHAWAVNALDTWSHDRLEGLVALLNQEAGGDMFAPEGAAHCQAAATALTKGGPVIASTPGGLLDGHVDNLIRHLHVLYRTCPAAAPDTAPEAASSAAGDETSTTGPVPWAATQPAPGPLTERSHGTLARLAQLAYDDLYDHLDDLRAMR